MTEVAASSDLFSPLKRRVHNQFNVSGIDFEQLSKLTVTPVVVDPRDVLFTEGGDATDYFFLERGWLVASSSIADGSRFIHRVYQAGDLIGVEDINWTSATSSVEAITLSSLGRVPKDQHLSLFANTTRLGATLYAVAMSNYICMVDQARANARLSGADRLGHLLLAIEARQRLTTDEPADGSFELPLSQGFIADIVGLSLVHTNKELQRLVRDGLIDYRGATYTILKRQELIARTGFTNRFTFSRPEWIEKIAG